MEIMKIEDVNQLYQELTHNGGNDKLECELLVVYCTDADLPGRPVKAKYVGPLVRTAEIGEKPAHVFTEYSDVAYRFEYGSITASRVKDIMSAHPELTLRAYSVMIIKEVGVVHCLT